MSHRSALKLCLAGAAVAAMLISHLSYACAPPLPVDLKLEGVDDVVAAPRARFREEIDQITSLVTPKFRLGESKWSPPEVLNTDQADIKELGEALKKMAVPEDQQKELLAKQKVLREALNRYQSALREWNQQHQEGQPAPQLGPLDVPDNLPPEFSLYFQGAIAFYRGEAEKAREAWEKLLKLPEEKRHYRSTWAAYMLGRSWMGRDPIKAQEWYQKVQSLAESGYADSLGLRVASYGEQARAALDRGQFNEAMKLYLTQYAAFEWRAARSLQITVRLIFNAGPEAIRKAAADPISRQVINACILSDCCCGPNWTIVEDEIKAWLEAAESVAIKDIPGADRLAWVTYNRGQFDLAQRWIDRAPADAIIARYLQAKLFTRAGKLEEAAQILSGLMTKNSPQNSLEDSRPDYEENVYYIVPVQRVGEPDRIRGELGILQFNLKHYPEALDALLQGAYWPEAMTVAQENFSTDELKAYVDSHGPGDGMISRLLAQRLTRKGYWKDARLYYPAELQKALDDYIAAIRTGANSKLPAAERAESFWKAFEIARQQGEELFGNGNPPGSDTGPPAEHVEDRRYWRYLAADHAWAAVQLMPDQSDKTAARLCDAGSWLKYKDPAAADRYYKALVKRCSQTELGKEADEKKWFPEYATSEEGEYEE